LRYKNEYFDELTYQLCLENKNWSSLFAPLS
jgi:hypothetical protein